jgi:hypothetical protein
VRNYDDPIEVGRGLVGEREVPAEFRWRGRRWLVDEVITHWVETGAWWEQPVVSSGSGGSAGHNGAATSLREREYWRVEARRHRRGPFGAGVFDLAYDHDRGRWHLVRAVD